MSDLWISLESVGLMTNPEFMSLPYTGKAYKTHCILTKFTSESLRLLANANNLNDHYSIKIYFSEVLKSTIEATKTPRPMEGMEVF